MPWQSPGWAHFRISPPWHLWSRANHTPPELERALGAERLRALWADAPADVADGDLAWCDLDTADAEAARRVSELRLGTCNCYEDAAGRRCELPLTSFCLNQCSRRGVCERGFCRCDPGWTGEDCSTPLVGPYAAVAPSSSATAAAATSAAAASEVLRPAIYVYELPNRFNGWTIESRMDANDCVYRRYGHSNETLWQNYAFGMELALHEALLNSRHRTHNPEAADFFYVPVYGGCYISRYFRPTVDHNLFLNDPWIPAPVRFYVSPFHFIPGSTRFLRIGASHPSFKFVSRAGARQRALPRGARPHPHGPSLLGSQRRRRPPHRLPA